MAEYRCPDCGAPVSTTAVVCPACGFPIRPNMLQRGSRFGGGGGGSNTALIVGLLVAGGLFAVVVIGVFAAIAIPRFTQAAARAKEKEGEALLRWGYTAEQTYFVQTGMYTTNVDTLAQLLSPPAPATPRRYTLEVSAASDRDLCLEAVPVPGTGTHALSMDAIGSVFRSAGCSGEPDVTAPLGSDAPPSGSGGDQGARQIMREVYESIVVYRAAHGGAYPRELSDVVTRVHDSPAMSEYEVMLVNAGEHGVCAALRPRNPLAGMHAYSVDHDGNLHQSASCMGETVERFTAPADDEAPAAGAGDPSSATYGEPGKREDKPLPTIEREP